MFIFLKEPSSGAIFNKAIFLQLTKEEGESRAKEPRSSDDNSPQTLEEKIQKEVLKQKLKRQN